MSASGGEMAVQAAYTFPCMRRVWYATMQTNTCEGHVKIKFDLCHHHSHYHHQLPSPLYQIIISGNPSLATHPS